MTYVIASTNRCQALAASRVAKTSYVGKLCLHGFASVQHGEALPLEIIQLATGSGAGRLRITSNVEVERRITSDLTSNSVRPGLEIYAQ